MKLVIIGTGDMGSALAAALKQRAGHDVRVRGSHLGSHSAIGLVQQLGVSEASHHDFMVANAVFVVVPWGAIAATAKLLHSYVGIVVSVVVPWSNGGDPRTDMISAAEHLSRFLPGARVVNAFTSISSTLIRNPGRGEKPSVIGSGRQ